MQSMGWQRVGHNLATEQQRSEGCFAKPLSMWLFPVLFWGSQGRGGQEVCSQGLCSGGLLFFLDCRALPEDRPVLSICPYASTRTSGLALLRDPPEARRCPHQPFSGSSAKDHSVWRGGPLHVLGKGPCCQQQRPVPSRLDQPTVEPNFFHPSPLCRPHFYIVSR